jgi:heme-degrading monooxygenase HmoA
MWARVSTYQLPAANLESAIERFAQALGDVDLPGFKRAELLVDRSSGKALTITLWESEKAIQSSVEAANRIRSSATDEAGVTIVDVAHYEIVEMEGGT